MNQRKAAWVTRIAINSALVNQGMELATFYQQANTGIAEVVLTEFAARVCYNSTGKMGSAPNFVQNVLQHGHLSVAEHASISLYAKKFGVYATRFDLVNRFFTRHSSRMVAGNIRSWLEFLAVNEYSPVSEVIISCFPPAFKVSEVIKEFDPEVFPFENQFSVPSIENVHLLSVNFGSLIRTHKLERDENATWGRFTFLIEGISRACSHQIARHRGASISEQSQRYVDATKNVSFTYPPGASTEQRNELESHYNRAMDSYRRLREGGMKKEDARFVLPMALHTRMVVSFDRKELVHFLKVRCAKDAQWEIRGVAERMAVQAMLATNHPHFVDIVDEFKLI